MDMFGDSDEYVTNKTTRRRLFCKYVNKYMFKIINKTHITAVVY